MQLQEAYSLLRLPHATLSGKTVGTETGDLNLECMTMSASDAPPSYSEDDRHVYLVFKVGATDYPLDPERVVTCAHQPGMRTYRFAGTPSDPAELQLSVQVAAADAEGNEKLDAFENILEQYVVEYHGPSTGAPAFGGAEKGDVKMPEPQTARPQTAGLGAAKGNHDLRGHLVMVNEDTGEVIGEVEDRFRIKEDPAMYAAGNQHESVVIEVPDHELTGRESDKATLDAFATLIPPDQRNWISTTAGIVSSAISMTTNLLITTITAGSNFYVSHSAPSPHHSSNGRGTPNPASSASGTATPGAPPPPPPRALVFLTSEKTRKNLATVHTLTGEAVKVSTKTVNMVDKMIRRAMGAKPKRTKYFSADSTAQAGSSTPGYLTPNSAAPNLPPRAPSPSPSTRSGLAPPQYATYQPGGSSSEKPALPPRRGASPAPGSSAAGPVPPPLPPRTLKTKDHILISADLILSTIDDATRRVMDTGTESIGKVVGHKYGPEAAQSSLLMANSARNVGLVYVDMSGIGRRALLKRAGKQFIKARVSSSQPYVPVQPQTPPVIDAKVSN